MAQRVYTQVRKLDLRLDRGRTPCGFLGQILVCPCSNQLLWRLQRDVPPTPPYSRPENTRTFHWSFQRLGFPFLRAGLSRVIYFSISFNHNFIVSMLLENIGIKTYRNVHLFCRVFDRSLVKCKICIIVKGRNKDRIYQRYYLFLTQLHAVKATKEKLRVFQILLIVNNK